MDLPKNKERIVHMHQMLFEMARGNFKQRIPLTAVDDELETLIVLINMVAEEMDESIFRDGYLNVHQSLSTTMQTTLMLDAECIIIDSTIDSGSFLGYGSSELLHQPLARFITQDSWDQFKNRFVNFGDKRNVLSLAFIDLEQISFTVSCTAQRLSSSGGTVLNIISPLPEIAYSTTDAENIIYKSKKSPAANAFLIQKLYDYILAHLSEPLPPIYVLASKFGTNEFKLKEDFRHFFKMSIHKFYNEERLKRAYFMLQTTTLSFKAVAQMNGYINYTNFCKAFKKEFGFSPSSVKMP